MSLHTMGMLLLFLYTTVAVESFYHIRGNEDIQRVEQNIQDIIKAFLGNVLNIHKMQNEGLINHHFIEGKRLTSTANSPSSNPILLPQSNIIPNLTEYADGADTGIIKDALGPDKGITEYAHGLDTGNIGITEYSRSDAGIIVILPHNDIEYRVLQREDIYEKAPLSFNRTPIFLSKYAEDTGNLKELERFRDMYPVDQLWESAHAARELPVIIRALVLVKVLSQKRKQVLVLAGDNVVDWGVLLEVSSLHIGANEVVCLLEGDDGQCNSFNMLYPMSIVNEILHLYMENGPLSHNIDDLLGWQDWLQFYGIPIVDRSGILSKRASTYDEFMEFHMKKDPQLIDLMKEYGTNESEKIVDKNVKEILLRTSNNVEYTPHPYWTILPENVNCSGEKGVFMMQSVANDYERRKLYRETFKKYNVKDFYFIFGRTKEEALLVDEAETYQDIVMYDEEDGYYMLTYKTFASMAFVSEFCPKAKAMIKMDQDVFLHFDQWPMLKKEFHEVGSIVDWDNMPEGVNCLYHVQKQGVQRGIPYSAYGWPYTTWPFVYHVGYCAGPTYMVTKNTMEDILTKMKTFAWAGVTPIKFVAAQCNEDVQVSGRYRVMINANLGVLGGDAEHVNHAGINAVHEKYNKELP